MADRQSMIQFNRGCFAGGRYVTTSKFIEMSRSLSHSGLVLGWRSTTKSASGAIFAASFLAGRALQPVDQMLASWTGLSRGFQAYAQINSLLGARPIDIAITALPDPKGRISVDKIAVARPASQVPILAGISFEVQPGEVLAIAGPSRRESRPASRSGGAQMPTMAISASMGSRPAIGIRSGSLRSSAMSLSRQTCSPGRKENIARLRSGFGGRIRMVVEAAQGGRRPRHDLQCRPIRNHDPAWRQRSFRWAGPNAWRLPSSVRQTGNGPARRA